jgi:hypothetical protein
MLVEYVGKVDNAEKPQEHPVFRVEAKREDGLDIYTIILSPANLRFLEMGCPEIGFLLGSLPNGSNFYISRGDRFSPSFEYNSALDGYICQIGFEIPCLLDFPTTEDVDRMSEQATDNLLDAIRNSRRIPIGYSGTAFTEEKWFSPNRFVEIVLEEDQEKPEQKLE